MIYTYKLRKKLHHLKNEDITPKMVVKLIVFLLGIISIVLFNALHSFIYLGISVGIFILLIVLSMLKGW